VILDKYRWLSKEANLSEQYMQDAVAQCDNVFSHYEKAYHSDVDWVPADCDMYYNMFLDGTIGGAKAIEMLDILYIQGHTENPSPVPSSDIPPRLPGQFFMSGLKTPKGFLLGTYKPAKLYLYDSAYHELLSLPTESVYMLYGPTPDGGYLFTTECPASVWRCSNDKFNDWHQVFRSSEDLSVAFDILPLHGGLCVFTSYQAWGNNQIIYKSDINGYTWSPWNSFTGNFVQCCTDGQTLYMIGNKDRRPCIIDHNGNTVLHADPSWKEQTINYASVKDGRFTLGLNNIEPVISDGTRRNGYVMSHAPFHSGIDLHPPFIMQTEAVDSGRYAIASIWNESGYGNPELAFSQGGVTGWSIIATIPMPSVQTIEIKDGVCWCYGGQKDQYGAVFAHKL
jgi:hypothetical protein